MADIDSSRATPGDIGRGIVGTLLPIGAVGIAAAFSGSTVLGLSALSIGSTAAVYVADPTGDNAARGAMDLIALGAASLNPAVAGGMATINLTFDLLSLSPGYLHHRNLLCSRSALAADSFAHLTVLDRLSCNFAYLVLPADARFRA